MRERQRILQNLETLYRDDFTQARERSDKERMERLDFEFQRDQLYLEVLLDVRELLIPAASVPDDAEGGVTSFIEKAQKLRNLTRLR